MKKVLILSALLLFGALALSLVTPRPKQAAFSASGDGWQLGFAAREIPLPEEQLYIAGYHQGVTVTGVRDLPRASALWLDTGAEGVLLISVDSIALSSGTADRIRGALSDFTAAHPGTSVNVISTHDHESADTLGLWGPMGLDGKNAAFMDALVDAAAQAAEAAYAARTPGSLYFSSTDCSCLLRDSRIPENYDPNLYAFRFEPASGAPGVYLVDLAAHAESMRGDNRLVSRDYPGVLADRVREANGYETVYVPGAIGGLIMTRELPIPFDAEKNVRQTGEQLAKLLLSIPREKERELAPVLRFASADITVPLDNTIFLYYAFLGILDNRILPGDGATGYAVRSSVSLLQLGDVALALVPGELFPELENGRFLKPEDPVPLEKLAAEAGFAAMVTVGLANDELGYIVPPSQFLVDPRLPYLTETAKDALGETHYEETNSVGPETARCISEGFRQLFSLLTPPLS